ncbi:MAG TPA: formate dehydrogenase subunit delta [Rhizomicrobium sp.]|jgi:formate dehydrogenase subunit delta|nr:formate dehydrogenase subunit delta [Rhizomicrobium sp.]
MNTDEKLVYMANQIASFFVAQGEARAVPAIADHIKKFWDPSMRRQFLAEADKPNIELHPYVREAVNLLKQTA